MNKYLLIASICCLLSSGIFGQSDYGCTDPLAGNFNPLAQSDDGSCCYENWITINSPGLPDFGAYCGVYSDNYSMNYFADADGMIAFCAPDGCYSMFLYFSIPIETEVELVSNGVVLGSTSTAQWMPGYVYLDFEVGESIGGCNDQGACNFDPGATCNDGSCDYSCFGCTDPLAPNYSPLATIDDGSCCEAANFVAINMSNLEFGEVIYISENNLFFYGDAESGEYQCYQNGCYQFEVMILGSQDVFPYEVVNYNGDVLATGEISNLNPTGYFSLN